MLPTLFCFELPQCLEHTSSFSRTPVSSVAECIWYKSKWEAFHGMHVRQSSVRKRCKRSSVVFRQRHWRSAKDVIPRDVRHCTAPNTCNSQHHITAPQPRGRGHREINEDTKILLTVCLGRGLFAPAAAAIDNVDVRGWLRSLPLGRSGAPRCGL